jgi:D-3-phosphoglycerate dehydrogenase
VGYEQISRRVIENTRLKFIASIRGGPKANIDVVAATEKGIPVSYTIGRTKYCVADHTMGLMLSVIRSVALTNLLLKQRVLTSKAKQKAEKDVIWSLGPGSPYDTYKGFELHTLTLGLVGFGQIGQEVAKRAKGFGMTVITYDPYVQKQVADEYEVQSVTLNELLSTSDVVSIHCNMTPETMGLIGHDQIALMKKTAIIINTARAAVVEKEPLYDALIGKQIAGAGLDVFHKEPLEPDDPLLDLDHVVLTPHIAGASTLITHHHSRLVTDEVLRFLRGERPSVVINPQVFNE